MVVLFSDSYYHPKVNASDDEIQAYVTNVTTVSMTVCLLKIIACSYPIYEVWSGYRWVAMWLVGLLFCLGKKFCGVYFIHSSWWITVTRGMYDQNQGQIFPEGQFIVYRVMCPLTCVWVCVTSSVKTLENSSGFLKIQWLQKTMLCMS